MQRFYQLIFILFMLSIFPACQTSQLSPEALPQGVQLGGKFYTQVTIQYEKNKFRTTNYRRGKLLSVNSEVRLLESTSKSIKVMLIQQEKELLIVNVPKHTGDDVNQAFKKLLAKQPVNLSRFNNIEREHIKSGTVAKGMSKAAVLIAIGYPPNIKTPTLDLDKWTYWSNRFNKFIVHFKNDKVTHIQD